MKSFLFLFILICLTEVVSAQYVYTIKADSVKLTSCDSSELIIENHTQGVPGFLFNTGNGRTVFKRALIQLDDSTYLLGGDTLRTSAFSLWRRNGNHIYNINTGNVGIHRTSPNVMLDLPGPVSIDDTSSYQINYRPILRAGGWIDIDDYEGFYVGGYTNLFGGDSSGTNNYGNYCTIIGNQAGTNNGGPDSYLGDWSTFVGFNTGYNNKGNNNTFMGYKAAYNNQGGDNTFVGAMSGYWNRPDSINQYSSGNSFFGVDAGTVSFGGGNVFLGSEAGHFNYGSYNMFEGGYAGNGSKGDGNMLMGFGSGMNNIGSSNILVGQYSGQSNTGTNNVIFGPWAGGRNNGDENILIGYTSGQSTFGGSNTFVGTQSGSLTRGTVGVTLLGGMSNADIWLEDNNLANVISDATAVGYNSLVKASNTMVFGDTAVNSWLFNSNAVAASGKALVVGANSTNGNGAYLTTGGVWTNASDRFKKEHFEALDNIDILDKIGRLPVTRWNYKGLSEQHIGPVAQDFYTLFHVGTDDKTISTIDPSGIALAGIQGLYSKWKEAETVMQHQQMQLQAQQAELAAQQTQINQLLEKVNNLAAAMNECAGEPKTNGVDRKK